VATLHGSRMTVEDNAPGLRVLIRFAEVTPTLLGRRDLVRVSPAHAECGIHARRDATFSHESVEVDL
jgi:hypothetical protein